MNYESSRAETPPPTYAAATGGAGQRSDRGMGTVKEALQVHLRGWGRSDLGLGVTKIASEPVHLYTSNLPTTKVTSRLKEPD